MLPVTYPVPTTAERIRSACVRAGGALLAIEEDDARADPVATPIRHLLDDGSFAVAVSVDRGANLRVIEIELREITHRSKPGIID